MSKLLLLVGRLCTRLRPPLVEGVNAREEGVGSSTPIDEAREGSFRPGTGASSSPPNVCLMEKKKLSFCACNRMFQILSDF